MISLKNEPLKNGNIIEDDLEMSDIENQEELEAEQDDFKQFLFNKRANRPDKAVIRCVYASSLTQGPEENILIMDSAADHTGDEYTLNTEAILVHHSGICNPV